MCYDCLDEDALDQAHNELNAPTQQREGRPYLSACKVSEVPANGSRGKVIIADHDEIAIFLLHGKLYAISNICPHQLSPLLAEGHIDKEALTTTCPLHGWVFHIPTGKFVEGSGRIPTYDLKVIDDEIWVEEPEPREP
jgi:nitrite reductase/ring-hydroxylating ferredoxin subunit